VPPSGNSGTVALDDQKHGIAVRYRSSMAMNEVPASARAEQLAAGGSTGGPTLSFLRNRRTSMIRSLLSYRGLVHLTVLAALVSVLGLPGETEAQTKKSSSRRTRLLKSSHPLLDGLGLLDCTDAPLGVPGSAK
jgi:hypothetical protein